MADPKFRTEIVADPAPYKAGMDVAAQIAQQTATGMAASMESATRNIQSSMEGTFAKVAGTFAKIQQTVIGVGAVIASGGMFGAATAKTVAMTKESQALARALGITVTEASTLNVALGDIFQTSDVLLGANRAMTLTLRENEEGIRKLGVSTRNQNGEFRNSLDIMLDVNKKLAGFREGTDRNIEGQKVYKKAWAEVAPMIELTSDVMTQARDKAERLNLALGPESIENIMKYRSSMSDVDDVLKAVAKTVSDVVMPTLTEMGNWFAETGPERVGFMRMATASFVATLLAMKGAAEVMIAGMVAPFKQLAILILTIADMMGHAMTGKFKEIPGIWKRGTDQMAYVFTDLQNRVTRNMDEIGKVIARGFFVPTNTVLPPRPGSGKGSTGGDDKGLLAKWDTELAAERNAYDQKKLEQGSFEQYTLEMERAFWAKKMVLAQGNSALLAAVSKKFYDVERQLRKNAFDTEVAEIKGQMSAAETNAQQRIDLANKVYMLQVQRHKAGSKEAMEALRDVQKATDDWAKQQREIRDLQADAEKSYQLTRVELERKNLETLEQLGIIKADEKIQRLRDLKEIEYTIELNALQRKMELMAEDPTTDPVKYQEQLNRIRALKEKHVLDMAALDNQLAVEGKKTLDKWLDPATDAFGKFVDGVIAGTRKWTDVLRGVLISVAQQYAQMGLKLAMDWVKTEVIKTQATVAGAAARTTAETTASVASTASTATTATTTIGSKAWEAAASVYASIAQIPYVGPFLAPAMAIAAAATVLGFLGNIFKAEGGFDVPSGMSPITQLHPREMVLPADLADRVRGVTGDAAGGGGALNFYITTPDTGSFAQYLRSNAEVLAPALRKLARNASRG